LKTGFTAKKTVAAEVPNFDEIREAGRIQIWTLLVPSHFFLKATRSAFLLLLL
jgi:hypothetical protein